MIKKIKNRVTEKDFKEIENEYFDYDHNGHAHLKLKFEVEDLWKAILDLFNRKL